MSASITVKRIVGGAIVALVALNTFVSNTGTIDTVCGWARASDRWCSSRAMVSYAIAPTLQPILLLVGFVILAWAERQAQKKAFDANTKGFRKALDEGIVGFRLELNGLTQRIDQMLQSSEALHVKIEDRLSASEETIKRAADQFRQEDLVSFSASVPEMRVQNDQLAKAPPVVEKHVLRQLEGKLQRVLAGMAQYFGERSVKEGIEVIERHHMNTVREQAILPGEEGEWQADAYKARWHLYNHKIDWIERYLRDRGSSRV